MGFSRCVAIRVGRAVAAIILCVLLAIAVPAAALSGGRSCTRATIGARHVCLSPGQRCRPRYQRQYGAKGFVCRRRHGVWRLQREHLSF
jgi:hypothetical protein